jgi:hypothetical protein
VDAAETEDFERQRSGGLKGSLALSFWMQCKEFTCMVDGTEKYQYLRSFYYRKMAEPGAGTATKAPLSKEELRRLMKERSSKKIDSPFAK